MGWFHIIITAQIPFKAFLCPVKTNQITKLHCNTRDLPHLWNPLQATLFLASASKSAVAYCNKSNCFKIGRQQILWYATWSWLRARFTNIFTDGLACSPNMSKIVVRMFPTWTFCPVLWLNICVSRSTGMLLETTRGEPYAVSPWLW